MAKGSTSVSTKVNFGRRKGGSAKKSYNKHSAKPKPYKGQGK